MRWYARGGHRLLLRQGRDRHRLGTGAGGKVMGLPPSGEIVARPMVVRACGCEQEFQYYKVDKYRAQRLAKFQGSRCPACVAKLQEEQKRAAGLPKGEALKAL